MAGNIFPISVLALALASCGGDGPVANQAGNVDGLPSIDDVAGGRDGTPSPDGSPPTNRAATRPAPANATAAAEIPAVLHGRWGLAPADCSSTRGDSKGLLLVGADGLQFYESRAVPVGNIEISPNSIGGDFAFAGEGQTWSKFQSLQVRDDKLVRTESSPMASFTYARCR